MQQLSKQMKVLDLIILAVMVLGGGMRAQAQKQEVPAKVRRIVERVDKYEERERKSVEEEIVRKKKALVSTLTRYEKRADTEEEKKFLANQIATLEKEISASERLIKGVKAVDIVIFDAIYQYDPPVKTSPDEQAEVVLTSDGKLKIRYMDKEGETVSKKVLRWELEGTRLIVLGSRFGDMFISAVEQTDRARISLEWGQLKRSAEAKVKE